jgi:histone acetyltransferase (RNA polymerase elongator complex component)
MCSTADLPLEAAALHETDPDYYKNTRFYKKNVDIEDIYAAWDNMIDPKDAPTLEQIVRSLAEAAPETPREFESALWGQLKRHKISCRKAQLLHTYQHLTRRTKSLAPSESLARHLVKKSSKSQSGVLVITVLTSPYPKVGGTVQKFSCAWDCHYCPSEPHQPKSYLHEEPAVKRANENGFDPVLQLTDRAATLAMNGHPVDKIELLVLGGTWASYPHEYQAEFCRDLFYAANTFWEREKRPRKSLLEEQTINQVCALLRRRVRERC